MKKTLTILLLLLAELASSQQSVNVGVTDVTRVTFLSPGLTYEKKTAKFQTLFLQAALDASITLAYSDALGNMSSVYVDPSLGLEYRFYYNWNRRQARGKRTEMNSMNYVAVAAETSFSKSSVNSDDFAQEQRRAINRFGIVWGMQRNYLRRFSLDLNIGPGYLITKTTRLNEVGALETKTSGQFTTLGQLTLGLWINKRKS